MPDCPQRAEARSRSSPSAPRGAAPERAQAKNKLPEHDYVLGQSRVNEPPPTKATKPRSSTAENVELSNQTQAPAGTSEVERAEAMGVNVDGAGSSARYIFQWAEPDNEFAPAPP